MPKDAVHKDAKITMSGFASVAQGETYELPDDSPWPRRFFYRVLEVKDGWVRYAQISESTGTPMVEFASARRTEYFTSMFRKVAT